MVHIEGEIVINRPVEEVFDFVADERNEPRYNTQMRRAEQLTEGPIGVGSRFRAEMLSMSADTGANQRGDDRHDVVGVVAAPGSPCVGRPRWRLSWTRQDGGPPSAAVVWAAFATASPSARAARR
jgi:hypothetical protein